MATITQSQLQGIFKKAESGGKKLDRAQVVQELVNRGHTVEGLNTPPKQKEHGFFSTLSSYLQAPSEAFTGAALKGISNIPGMEFAARDKSVANLSENLSKSADVARIGIPLAAGVATGGLSLPVSAAISGVAGGGSSLIASGLEKAAGEDQTLAGAAGEAVFTGGVDAGLDAATRGLFSLAKPLLKAKGAKELTKELSQTVGKVVQSKNADDIARGVGAMRSLGDSSQIKTFEDLAATTATKLKALRAAQDDVLNAVPQKYTLDQLGTTVKVGEKSATDNFVKEALDGLEELYLKTGNTEGVLKTQTMKELAADKMRGLTPKQINDLAREYGRGFKAFSDATGQPLTSVNAKKYETVRKGLKNVSRGLMPNDAAKVIDEEMSNLITVQDLADDMAEAVQQLSNKIEERNLFQKVVASVGGGLDMVLGRAPSTFISSALIRGNVGMKQLNSLQIQKSLPKNLATIQALLRQIDTLPEGQVVGAIKELIGQKVGQGVNLAGQAAVGAVTNSLNK